MRRILAVALSLGAILSSQFNAATTADNTFESCFRSRINFERTSRGINALANNEALNMIASTHSDEMATRDTIYHNDNLPNENGIPPFTAVGENVGMGSSCPIVHEAFMNSPGHRANILDPAYRDLGVGVTQRDDTIYVTEIFYTRAGASKPSDPTSPSKPKPPAPKCTCPN